MRLTRTWLALALLASPAAGAEPEVSSEPACFPECRAGFVCHHGACVSECNPPCMAGDRCVAGGVCEPPTPGQGPIVEPPPPRRIEFAGRPHSAAAFHYGFPAGVEVGGQRLPGPSRATLGASLRSDIPVARYLLVGPLFQFGVYRPAYYFDLDFYLRGRLPIDLEDVDLQFWAGMPVGLTFDFLKSDFAPALDGFALGWNIGVLAGGAVHFSKDFGLMSEFGWLQHRAKHGVVGAPGVEIVLRQVVWNIGFMLRN